MPIIWCKHISVYLCLSEEASMTTPQQKSQDTTFLCCCYFDVNWLFYLYCIPFYRFLKCPISFSYVFGLLTSIIYISCCYCCIPSLEFLPFLGFTYNKNHCPAIFAETPGGDMSTVADVTDQEVVDFLVIKMETLVPK